MSMEGGTRTRLVTVLVLLLVLAAGFVLGMAASHQVTAPGLTGEQVGRSEEGGDDPERAETGETSGSESGSRRPLLIEQVGLSDVQNTKKDSIVGYYRERMRALHEEFDSAYNTRYREIVIETRDALRSLLSDEQRLAYDSLLVASDRRREERRNRDSLPKDGRP